MPNVNSLTVLVESLTKDQTIELAELCLAEMTFDDRIVVVLRAFGGTPENAFELDELIAYAQEKLDKLEAEAKGGE